MRRRSEPRQAPKPPSPPTTSPRGRKARRTTGGARQSRGCRCAGWALQSRQPKKWERQPQRLEPVPPQLSQSDRRFLESGDASSGRCGASGAGAAAVIGLSSPAAPAAARRARGSYPAVGVSHLQSVMVAGGPHLVQPEPCPVWARSCRPTQAPHGWCSRTVLTVPGSATSTTMLAGLAALPGHVENSRSGDPTTAFVRLLALPRQRLDG